MKKKWNPVDSPLHQLIIKLKNMQVRPDILTYDELDFLIEELQFKLAFLKYLQN